MVTDEEARDPTAPAATGVAPTSLDPTFREDPHPVLDDLRRREPVHHDEQLKRWVLTRHDDVSAIPRDRAHSVDPREGAPGTFSRELIAPNLLGEPSLAHLDPPDHTRLRGLVSKAFSPARP